MSNKRFERTYKNLRTVFEDNHIMRNTRFYWQIRITCMVSLSVEHINPIEEHYSIEECLEELLLRLFHKNDQNLFDRHVFLNSPYQIVIFVWKTKGEELSSSRNRALCLGANLDLSSYFTTCDRVLREEFDTTRKKLRNLQEFRNKYIQLHAASYIQLHLYQPQNTSVGRIITIN